MFAWTTKTLNVKHFAILCFALLFTTIANAQTNPDSYEIIAEPQEIEMGTAITAFEAANWDKYRFETKRRTLTFACGMQIELRSAAELRAATISFDQRLIIPDHIEITTAPLFKILSTGQIAETYDVKNKK
jgi:K+-transporting ATPase A subunit